MSGFLVDSTTLLAVRGKLGSLHDQLLSMHNVIYGYWGTLGGRALEGELEHFCGTWHYGVTELADEITGMMRRLEDAAAAYERIERRISDAGQSGTTAGSTTTTSSGGAPVGSTGTAGSAGAAGAHRTQAARHPNTHHAAHHPQGTVVAGSGGAAITGTRAGTRDGRHDQGRSRHSDSGSGETIIEGGKVITIVNSGGAAVGSGSGTTVIGGGPVQSGGSRSAGGSSTGGGSGHGSGHGGGSHEGSGSGTTVIGGGASGGSSGGASAGGGKSQGSGKTVIDARRHEAAGRQAQERAAAEIMLGECFV